MWAFVIFETMIFTGYFAFYLYDRARHPDPYLEAQAQLHLTLGILETLVLITSSLFIARGVQAARAQRWRPALHATYATGMCGLLFLAMKIVEWVEQVDAGNGFTSSEFFSFYYFLTAIHVLHLLIGFVFLGVVVYQVRAPERRSQEVIETCATYWHTVDYLWVLIFAMLYGVR